jgi:hypothetical protein
MGQSQRQKDAKKKEASQAEIEKASKETAEKCMIEIQAILKKYNCSLDVRHKQDTVMGEPILRFGPVIIHHIKPLR